MSKKRSLWVVLALAGLMWFRAQPASAGCYDCVMRYSCSGFLCEFWWECRDEGVGCSGCQDGCMEGFDTCTLMGSFCQWALVTPVESRQPRTAPEREAAFLLSLAQPLINSPLVQ